jgi:hypothetical protein
MTTLHASRALAQRSFRPTVLVTFISFVLACLLAPQALADSIRCEGKLLLEGDTKAKLLHACGEPLSKDVVGVERAYANGEQIRVDYAEVWTYPTPNTQGFQQLRFEAGQLVGDGMRCKGALVQTGDTAAVVRSRCGAPTTRDSAGLHSATPGPASLAQPIAEVLLEHWVYDRGAGKLQAIVVLRAGRIVTIEDGRRR